MKTKRLITMLLTLMLMVSALAVTASADEEMDTSPFLCYSWLNNFGEGWFEEPDQNLEWNRGMRLTALDHMWVVFYHAAWNESAGEWDYTPVDPAELELVNLSMATLAELEEPIAPDSNLDGDCAVQMWANDWAPASVSYTLEDGTELTMDIEVQRNEDGFYSSQVLSNETFINRYLVNPLAEENVFYFGFESEYWTLQNVELAGGCEEFVTLENTDQDNVYKITVKPEVAENIWNNGGFNVWVAVTVYHEDDNGYQEEVWEPGLWCEPLWMHEMETDARFNINYEEHVIIDGVAIKNVLVGTESDEEGNTWDVWEWVETDLPEGVSYDADTNTLTLNNANLTNLEMGYHWQDMWSGDEGWNLPNENLTIELIGENTIISETDRAVCLREEVQATITGDGSLHVKATNEIRQNEWGDYMSYPAFIVEGGANLTIAGNADVTVEIAGAAWNGNADWNEQSHLTALHMMNHNLTLCDNAVLTTVVPEGALASGTVAPNPDDPWYFPGGYSGIGSVLCLTVNDNATLNTTNIGFHDLWAWDEVNENEYYIGSGSFVLNGGTVNINAIPEISYQEYWAWDEETQTDVLVCFNQYDFRGLNFGGADSAMEVNGGELNITIAPTEEQNETGVYAEALNISGGDLTMGGGTMNLGIPHGCGLYVGGWDENGDGTVTMTGGEINMTEGYNWIEVAPYGSANLNGGSIHIANGELTLCTNWEYIEEADTHVRTQYPNVVIDGTNVTIDNGRLNLDGDLTINSGSLNISLVGDANRDPWDGMWLAHANGNLTVNGGELNLIGNDIDELFVTYGDYHQTGGEVRFVINETDEWREAYSDVQGITPRTYAFQSYANVTIDGGVMNTYAHYGIMTNDNGDNKLVVNGGEVVASGEMNGIMLYQDAEFNGGMVRAISRGREHENYDAEGNPSGTYKAGNALVLTNGAVLTVNGGDHVVECYINEGYPKATYGINLFGGAVEFNGGSIKLNADFVLASFSQTEPGNPFSFSEDMCVYSLHDGCQPKLLEDVYYDYMYDENGNVMFDEEGNPVYDESVVYYDYWLEEDGIYEGTFGEYLDPATYAIITSTKCGDDATWSLEDGVLTVSGTGAMYDYTNSLSTGVAPWFWLIDCGLVDSVEQEETVTTIGSYAFWHQDAVEAPVTMTIGANVETIGVNAFASDAVLTVVCATAGEEYVTEYGMEATVLHQFLNGKCGRCGAEMDSPFTDVPAGTFYFDPVVWAVENGVTTGATATTFDPNGTCLRAHVVTFLWRAAGSPEPSSTSNPFVDVNESDFYYKPVLWAVEKGITNGVDATHFGPLAECNRAQVVTFLHRAKGSPTPESMELPFTDVSAGAWYAAPIAWAVENGITNGLSATQFGPNATCNRAQVVTFLYRAYVNK